MKHNTYNNIMLLLAFLFFLCKFEYCYSNKASCIEVERIALLKFKKGLIDRTNRLSSWTNFDCCKWEGVFCDSITGHVLKLDLHNTATYDDVANWYAHFPYTNYSNTCLGGEINHSLINLTHLNYLDLSLNNFSEIQIPEFFGSFKNLRYLNLSTSGFVGKVPTQLGNLSNLEYLHLGSMPEASDILTVDNLNWLASLSSLKSLDLSLLDLYDEMNWLRIINNLVSLSSLKLATCFLQKEPNPLSLINSTSLISVDLYGSAMKSKAVVLWLSNLTRLEYLNLSQNYFSYSVFEHFSSTLKVLDLSSNHFHSSLLIPLCKLHNLVSIDLSGNDLHGFIPHCLENLTSLTSLNFGYNSFRGSFPKSINHLCKLQSLDLSANELSGLLRYFIGARSECLSSSLQVLSLDNNYFTGQLPNQLYMYKNLKTLSIGSNSLSGPIADSLGNLSMLSWLDISNNKCNGTIPTSLGQLSNLEHLDISTNSFQGVLSESHFSKLTNLKKLFLSGNSLLFNVSSNWIPPFQVTVFEMDSIKIGPHFPQWLLTQKRVDTIRMSNASISDVIPDWFGIFLWNSIEIDLSKNNIYGELSVNIEAYMDEFSQIYFIQLSDNHLTGEIPKWLCSSRHLVLLDLSSNELSGGIPSCFRELQNLEVLDLGNNHFYGHIPSSLSSLSKVYSLHLQNNKLEGEIPSSFQNLTSLIALDLSENGFMDVIPPWIGENLSSLKFLNFQKNKFFGDIPMELCYLDELQLLNLANNNLSGHIPRCFNNFTSMIEEPIETYYYNQIHMEHMYEDIKGLNLQYTANLEFLRTIDLSGNHIIGEIPPEIMVLVLLNNLNLSRNNLSGTIPQSIGNLSKIESLDFSWNALSGPIPQSLSSLNFLSYLNLSFNKLYGRIPTGHQLQTLDDPSIYIGNEGLCGVPLLKSCLGDDKPSFVKQPTETKLTNDDHEFLMWFYAGLGPGFFVGFIGVLCTLLFKTSWRYAYFKCLENTFNKVLSSISIKRNRR